MSDALDAVVEIFTWAGFGLGGLLAGIALIVYLVDGTWLPARAVVEHDGDRVFVRWFDEDGDVNEADLDHAQRAAIGDADMADIFYRRGSMGRMRLTGHSPLVRGIALLAAGLVGLGVVALVVSTILLFTRG